MNLSSSVGALYAIHIICFQCVVMSTVGPSCHILTWTLTNTAPLLNTILDQSTLLASPSPPNHPSHIRTWYYHYCNASKMVHWSCYGGASSFLCFPYPVRALRLRLHPLVEQCGGPPCPNCPYILGLASGTLTNQLAFLDNLLFLVGLQWRHFELSHQVVCTVTQVCFE